MLLQIQNSRLRPVFASLSLLVWAVLSLASTYAPLHIALEHQQWAHAAQQDQGHHEPPKPHDGFCPICALLHGQLDLGEDFPKLPAPTFQPIAVLPPATPEIFEPTRLLPFSRAPPVQIAA
ncbi:MAG: hypothetical protein E1N59_2175 [Puniceicoccaceae bacterium 5H]|nr:MAG: hypothetical protein E1N59_2175 [Puniceicoccaceae bacterium 5H]